MRRNLDWGQAPLPSVLARGLCASEHPACGSGRVDRLAADPRPEGQRVEGSGTPKPRHAGAASLPDPTEQVVSDLRVNKWMRTRSELAKDDASMPASGVLLEPHPQVPSKTKAEHLVGGAHLGGLPVGL